MPVNATSDARIVPSAEPGTSPPGPRGLPLLGNLLDFARDPLVFFTKCSRQFGDVACFRVGSQTALLLNNPDEIGRVLVKEHRSFPKNRLFWRQVTAVFGNGLLNSEGDVWHRQRHLAAPAFVGQKLSSYAEFMVSASERMLDSWRVGEVRNAHVDMMGLTLRIAARTLFGTDVEKDVTVMENALDDILEEIAARIPRPFVIPDAIPLPGHLRYRRGIRRIEAIVARLIAERRASKEQTTDLLSTLMSARNEDGLAMSDSQLRDEVMSFLLAGHETTALALSWTIYLLTQHPEVDAALANEARNILADRSATIEDMPRLQFTERVVTESMRLYPPAWAIGREARRDCDICGYHVRAGTPIYISPWVMHRDPRFFQEPESFRPDRWDTDFAHRLPRFAYIPFGGGPRICIGNRFAMIEAVLILATLIRRVRFVGQRHRSVRPFPSITLRPKGGVWAEIQPRAS